jgi:hypothetical protein
LIDSSLLTDAVPTRIQNPPPFGLSMWVSTLNSFFTTVSFTDALVRRRCEEQLECHA